MCSLCQAPEIWFDLGKDFRQRGKHQGSIFLLSQRLPNTCWILDCLLKYVLSSSLPVDKVEHLGASCELTIIIPYKCSFF